MVNSAPLLHFHKAPVNSFFAKKNLGLRLCLVSTQCLWASPGAAPIAGAHWLQTGRTVRSRNPNEHPGDATFPMTPQWSHWLLLFSFIEGYEGYASIDICKHTTLTDGKRHKIAECKYSTKAASPPAAGFICVGERVHSSTLSVLVHPERQGH